MAESALTRTADRIAEDLREKAAQVPGGDAPVVREARERALRAAEIVAGALTVDPTLSEHGLRDIDLCAEILRQLRPLSRQATQYLEHQRLTEAGALAAEIARIGRVNPQAVEETAALSARIVEIAERVEAATIPDWDTPQRIRERSERLLPDSGHITDIADRLATAIRPALALSHPADTAVRLSGLVEQLRALADAEVGGPRD